MTGACTHFSFLSTVLCIVLDYLVGVDPFRTVVAMLLAGTNPAAFVMHSGSLYMQSHSYFLNSFTTDDARGLSGEKSCANLAFDWCA